MISLRIGLLGLGNVSTALIRHSLATADEIIGRYGLKIEFTHACDSLEFYSDPSIILDIIERKTIRVPGSQKTTETLNHFCEVIDDKKIDMLIDCLPSSKNNAGSSLPLLIQALKKNISIICVNKAPLVFQGEHILKTAEEYRTKVGFSGATAGCLPSSGVMLNELVGSVIYQIRGILNGTSNYVLDSVMFDDITMEQAVQNAIEQGIAEPDYEFDLSGLDTCFKMIILGLLVTGKNKPLGQISRSGILGLDTEYIRAVARSNKLIRLVGSLSAEKSGLEISVKPEVIDSKDTLFAVRGKGKGIMFRTKYMGDLTLLGGSSGRTNIAAAILKDIINIAKQG